MTKNFPKLKILASSGSHWGGCGSIVVGALGDFGCTQRQALCNESKYIPHELLQANIWTGLLDP